MKTPREILLERHQAAAPKLDLIRRAVVAARVNNKATKEQSSPSFLVSLFLCCSRTLLQELVLPSRRIWAGLAAAWILIVAANVTLRDRSPAVARTSAPGPVLILSFQQQEKLLTELMGPEEPRVAQPPREARPRSEGRMEILMT